MVENELSGILVDIFFKIHTNLGPGLFESVYLAAICTHLDEMGIPSAKQVHIPVYYRGRNLNLGFKADIIVDNKIIVEVKSIEQIHGVHAKQLTTYLKLSGLKLGLLVNFNVELIKYGIKRVVNGL